MNEKVILVNEQDQEIGEMEKLEAHRKGLLHRAFSVFIFDRSGNYLLQKRNPGKYHSGGLWTNTCCGHPRPGEDTGMAAQRRLFEEMGIRCQLQYKFKFSYKSEFKNGITENEIDHVFFGKYDKPPNPDSEEVAEWKYADSSVIKSELTNNSEEFTTWFRICFPEVLSRKTSENIRPSSKSDTI
ncbi:MAG: isopentenyl-diphosphate Delta-isomerase [Bacteroidetes bacterium]|nr:MAG: isopentenyl-diphosphate Delta-isomerase [Bacteroidota bacterium]REK05325.1 MAG: isopentenyl-diphosphate Delta-isomerase [Bacteroidota bacterium]REK36394.1 MAG: isopentenyl-diphosphate Delta-isomerase [Bacteroidota bacterium]REK51129.1 MAG: isopentenyl-diphosphate Delta-isomerase [Bacteroidota bacterium]